MRPTSTALLLACALLLARFGHERRAAPALAAAARSGEEGNGARLQSSDATEFQQTHWDSRVIRLHRINTLTDELAMLKSVVMKHTGAGGSGDDGASSKLRTPSRDNSKNLMSQRSLDHAHRSRSRSESFR